MRDVGKSHKTLRYRNVRIVSVSRERSSSGLRAKNQHELQGRVWDRSLTSRIGLLSSISFRIYGRNALAELLEQERVGEVANESADDSSRNYVAEEVHSQYDS